MMAADGNVDGQVDNSDKNDVWLLENLTNGYESGDFNLDGQVNNTDKDNVWNLNSGRGTQMPD
jgi:hypothetical protein